MNTCRRTLVAALFLFICIAGRAQDFPLNGNMNICLGECFDYSIEPDSSFSSLQIIRYLDGGAPWIIYATTESIFTICWNASTIPEPGGYILTLEMTYTDNTTMSWDFVLNAQASSTIEHVPIAGACPVPNSSIDDYTICQSNSSTFALTPQGPFHVVGEQLTNIDSYTLDGNLLTINWGSGSFGALSLTVENEDGTGPSCGYTLDISADYIPPPVASFNTMPAAENGVVKICQGQTVFFQNNSTNGQTYEWILGGANSDNINVEYTYESPGTYEAILIASSDCFCSDTTSLIIEVTASESPQVDCVGTICGGETVTYSSNTNCGTFIWNVSSNGTIIDGGSQADDFITIDWGDGPVGTIELTVENCNSFNVCMEPSIIQVPIISNGVRITGPERVCQRAVVQYALPAYSGSDFVWTVSNLGDIINGQGTNEITVEWSDIVNTITQEVSVNFENCYLGCDGSSSLMVAILPDFFILGSTEVCEGGILLHQAHSTLNNSSTSANWQILDENGIQIWASDSPFNGMDMEWSFPPGNYTLEASPANLTTFCSDGFSIPVTVVAPAPLVDDIDGAVNICPGSIYTYEAISSLPNSRFTWEVNNGGNITTRQGNPINIHWGASLPYELSVRQVSTNSLACESELFVQTIEATPDLMINGSDNVCHGQISTYTTQANESIDFEWAVHPSAAGIITSFPTPHSVEVLWQATGTANLSLEGCGEMVEFAVDVHGDLNPIVNHPMELCSGETANVQTSAPFSSYSWRNENGEMISTQATLALGPGYYQLVAENELGCFGDTTFSIGIYQGQEVAISTPNPTEYCNAIPNVTFYVLNVSSVSDFQWLQDGNPVGGNDSAFHTNAFGSYRVQVTDVNGCQSLSNLISVVEDCSGDGPSGEALCTNGEADFEISSTSICNNRIYTNQSPNMIPGSVEWIFDDPESGADNTSVLDNPVHRFSRAGFYDVFLSGDFEDPSLPGVLINCGVFKTDTIVAVAGFEFEASCPGDPVQFRDISTHLPGTSIVSWSWDFGDPMSGATNISDEANPSHTFTNIDNYIVTLTIITASGCMASITKQVELPEPFSIDFTTPNSACIGTAIHFEANIPPNVTYLRWDFGDLGSGSANRSELTNTYHVFEQTGTYNVSLFAQNIYGCTSTFSQDITIAPNDLAGELNLSMPSPICSGDTIVLSAPAGGVSWQWSTGETTSSIEVTETGIFSLTVIDSDGCRYSPAPVAIDVFPKPESPIRVVEYNEYGQPISIFYDQYEACEGADVILETPPNPNYTFEWSTGIFGTEMEFSEVKGNQLESGSYDIFLAVTDTSTNCTFEVGPYSIIIHPVPENVEISVNPSGLICESTTATFMVENPDPSFSYLWNTGQSGFSITASQAGEYYATAITELGCHAQSNHLEITPGPDITKIPSGCHTRCRPDTLCLPSIPGVISYQWFFEGNPIAAPDGTMPELIAMESGNYWLEMESNLGCMLTSGTLTLDLFDGFGAVEGQVYFDVNDNGLIDAGDTLVSGIDIRLLSGNQIYLADATSDENGAYTFANIVSTNYVLEIDTNSLPPYYGVIQPLITTELIGCDAETTVNWLLFLDCIPVEDTLDFSICRGESITYNGNQFDTDTTFTANYTTVAGCDSIETVTIEVFEENVVDVALSVCEGESLEFEGSLFQAGDQMDFFYTNQYGCDSTVSVSVSAFPPIVFDLEVEKTCPNETSGHLMVETSGNYEYRLDAGAFQSDPGFENLNAGNYQLFIQDENGCEQMTEFEIEATENLVVNVEDAIMACDEMETTVTVEVWSGDTSAIEFVWEDGFSNPQRIVQEPGVYSVTISDNCQSIEKEINVELEDLGLTDYFYIPNAFSPNDDGINDKFQIQLGGAIIVTSFQLQVFDRWGNQVFVGEDINETWDGQFRSKIMAAGVYVWYLKANVIVCGQELTEEQFGDIVLVK